MRSHVAIVFGADEIGVDLPPAEGEPMSSFDARRWLDEQFLAHECEPLRASGKLLTADKVLAVADAIGPRRFGEDAALRLEFARAVTAALARPVVRIDVDARSVTY